ncbi:hypothetical protein RW115_06755 [Macrococcus capreoli]
MPLKTLSLNKALFSNLSRSIIFLSIINVICTFILVPFSYVIAHMDSSAVAHQHSKYLIGETMTMPIYFFGTMAYALLCAAFLTYYFKSQAASDFIHSLPIKRERILMTVYAVFFSHLMINLVVNGLITWIVSIKYATIDCEKIVLWILINLIIDFFIFTITMLFGLFINNMLNHIVSSIILIVSPYILGTMVFTTHMFMFKGLQSYPDSIMKHFTVPIKFLEDLTTDQMDFKYLLIIFVVSLVMFISLFVIYKNRKNERINEAYATHYAHFIIFYVSMLIATLLGGIIFNSIFNEQKLIMIFIYFVAFTLIYIFLEMMAQKSVRIQFNRKLYSITLALVAVALVAVYLMGQSREKYVPEAEAIKYVSTTFDEKEQAWENGILSDVKVSDKKFIQDVVNSHKQLILADKPDLYNEEQVPVSIKYVLNNGKKINRTYNVRQKDFELYMNKVATKNNAAIITKYIDWDKLLKRNVTLNIETADSSFAGNELNNKQKDILKQLLINKYNKNYVSKNGIPNEESALHFTFSNDAPNISEENLSISIYDKEILQFLIKEKLITDASSALPLGDVYDLGDKSNYKKIKDEDDITKLEFAKKISRDQFKSLFKEKGADPSGNHLYFFEQSYNFVLMNN